MSESLGLRVQYEQPTQIEGTMPVEWKTKYRVLPDQFKFGIPKGRRIPPETLIDTARREFSEEIGGEIRADLLNDCGMFNGYQVYHFHFNERDLSPLLRKLEERVNNHYSELFDVQFHKLDDIVRFPHEKLNRVTLDLIVRLTRTNLPRLACLTGGAVSTRKSRKRKSRKNNK